MLFFSVKRIVVPEQFFYFSTSRQLPYYFFYPKKFSTHLFIPDQVSEDSEFGMTE